MGRVSYQKRFFNWTYEGIEVGKLIYGGVYAIDEEEARQKVINTVTNILKFNLIYTGSLSGVIDVLEN